MAIKDKINILQDVNGYLGAGIFTPQGEMLEGVADVSGIHFETSGSQVHDTLLNAQKMSSEAGFGAADMIQIDTEMGIVFCKCFNDGDLHFHTVLVIKSDGNIAMAKMKMKKFVNEVKSEF